MPLQGRPGIAVAPSTAGTARTRDGVAAERLDVEAQLAQGGRRGPPATGRSRAAGRAHRQRAAAATPRAAAPGRSSRASKRTRSWAVCWSTSTRSSPSRRHDVDVAVLAEHGGRAASDAAPAGRLGRRHAGASAARGGAPRTRRGTRPATGRLSRDSDPPPPRSRRPLAAPPLRAPCGERLPHRALHRRPHRARVREAHLGLGRVHVHVHQVRAAPPGTGRPRPRHRRRPPPR